MSVAFLSPEDTFQYIPGLPEGSLIEFGVYNGNYLRRIIKGANDSDYPFSEVWGFDSWEGLPKEDENVYLNPDWPEGAFNVAKDYDLKTPEECMQFVCQRIYDFVGKSDTPPLNFISGFFTESLTKELGEEMKEWHEASYVHVDVDLYISTKQCLDWLFTYKIPKEGCLFRFDDWMSTPLFSAGNSKAFAEATNKFGIMWTPLGCNTYIFEKQGIE